MIDRERDFDFDESGQQRPMGGPSGTTSSLGSEDDNLVDLAKQRGSQATDQAKQTAGDMMEQARHQASLRVSDQKDQVAETLNSIAHAVRETGSQLRSQDQSGIAEYADRAADQIERFSGYLNEHDLNNMVHEAENFARRQPLLFVGGTFLLGFLGARFLKSSAPDHGYGLGYGPVPRSRVPARPGYPDSPGRTYGTGGYQPTQGYGQGSHPSQGTPSTPGTTTGTGGLPNTGTGMSSNPNMPPGRPEDADEAA